MRQIRYYTNIAPHYRKHLWQLFIADHELNFNIFFGKASKLGGIKEIDLSGKPFHSNKSKLHLVNNFRIIGLIVYQSRVISDAILSKPDFAIFMAQEYIISTWLATLIYKLKGVKIIFWGHGLYGNEGFIKKKIRFLFYKISDFNFIYNNRSRQLLINAGINQKKIFTIYNSLDYDNSFKIRNSLTELKKEKLLSFFKEPNLPLLIFIGRLTKTKKIDLLIQSLILLLKRNIKYNLLLIGDGPDKNPIQIQVEENNLTNYVYLYGESYSEEINAQFLSIADICVSPGNVGLTAIYALSYGTPVCTHNNFNNQMPEFESIIENKTGCFFEENNSRDLVDKISQWMINNNNKREEIRNNCYEIVDKYYNPHNQIQILKQVIAAK